MIVQINIFQDEDGVWCASGVGVGVHTQGRDLQELFANIEEAAQLHYEDELAQGKTIDVLITAQKELVGAGAILPGFPDTTRDACTFAQQSVRTDRAPSAVQRIPSLQPSSSESSSPLPLPGSS
jgi:predicted RNase H-like HicB family nuclease